MARTHPAKPPLPPAVGSVGVSVALASPLTLSTALLSGANTTPVQNTLCAFGRARSTDSCDALSTCTRTRTRVA